MADKYETDIINKIQEAKLKWEKVLPTKFIYRAETQNFTVCIEMSGETDSYVYIKRKGTNEYRKIPYSSYINTSEFIKLKEIKSIIESEYKDMENHLLKAFIEDKPEDKTSISSTNKYVETDWMDNERRE